MKITSLPTMFATTIMLLAVGCGTDKMSNADKVAQYTKVQLTADLSRLSDNQRAMLPLLIEAAQAMDEAFWLQASDPKDEQIALGQDDATRQFIEINYGPWDRLDGNASFVEGVGPKPLGAGLYPADMTVDEFNAAVENMPELQSLYTVVERNADGALVATPYSEAYKAQYDLAADRLRQAAELAEDPGFKGYLEMRAEALLTDNYQPSDMAWMDMKNNAIDVVIGPIESYEDRLFSYKASNEGFVLIKDMEWSKRLSHYIGLLPRLQQGLPVDEAYRQDEPGTNSDLNVYDAIYYAGDANAGAKTIAINLPNDEEVQLAKGTRRLQLRNSMQAKFDRILMPISELLIEPSQRQHITFEAFFDNTMFHEVAHGLGIKGTLDGAGTVREAMKDQASRLEEGKADVLGLYMISQLSEWGELGDHDINDNYVTFVAGIFRSIRFGAASAHGVANLIRFNYFMEMNAIMRGSNGTYHAMLGLVPEAVASLSAKILTLQGDGDYDGVVALVEKYGVIGDQLQTDLDLLAANNIPVDIIFDQGVEVLGL
ncbi:Zn-dependent hydrolase [Candidatus Neomarinimicrobiota bacterium]